MKFIDLLNIFMRSRDRNRKYKELKNDPERAPKVVRYGVSAIILDVIAIALVVLCLFTFETITSALLTNAGVVVIVTALIWFVALSVLIILPVGLIISALISSIYQLKMNKKAIGWIALVLTILTLGGSIFFFLSLI
ncbi:MAG: hypothetical protein PHP83_03145 [Clostridia bacterium]|jgi:hypothetical protein|nr:hypothetical protein [Clostridia bacterium]